MSTIRRALPPEEITKRIIDAGGNHLRETGVIERICSHGVGHPVGHMRGWLRRSEGIHGCDGCCIKDRYPSHETRDE